MTAFPRTILPITASWPQFPTGLVSRTQTGKSQFRQVSQVGRTWTETYRLALASDGAAVAFFATLNNFWRSGAIFQIEHRALMDVRRPSPMRIGYPGYPLSILVNAVGATGTSLSVSTNIGLVTVLQVGDVVVLPGLSLVYDLTADLVTDIGGYGTLSINPPIYAGASPTNAAAILNNFATLGTVTFRARIASLTMPSAGVNTAYVGCAVTFEEVPA
jgi:hypothetical protein